MPMGKVSGNFYQRWPFGGTDIETEVDLRSKTFPALHWIMTRTIHQQIGKPESCDRENAGKADSDEIADF